MPIVVRDIKIPLGSEEHLSCAAAKSLGLRQEEIERCQIKRQSIDSRKKEVLFVYTVHVTLKDKHKQKILEEKYEKALAFVPDEIIYGSKKTARAVVVGTGPCGLFAALTLARHGYRPLVLERGKKLSERTKDVALLGSSGVLDPESNICFGAGGAGAFSDGKLTTRIKDYRCEQILDTLVSYGAPEEILYAAKPHTGTEYIRKAVDSIINEIERLSGSVSFGCRLTAVKSSSGSVSGIVYKKDGLLTTIETNSVILAIGHSARDTYEYLFGSGITMAAKPFAVGLRIEHLREFINKAQYGENHTMLGAAEYRLTSNLGQRGVYTFCMCPGGEVINSSTEHGGIAINGMSYYARNGQNSNSAVVVSVSPQDFGSSPLDGIAFQRMLETSAYNLAGGRGAPVQMLGDFKSGRPTKSFKDIRPSFSPNAVPTDLNKCLPELISSGIKHAAGDFGRMLKDFDMDCAVLTGTETRTSAPLRILRDDKLQSPDLRGLFPAGEGAGYAGGIVSAAVDGIKCAQMLMSEYAKPV